MHTHGTVRGFREGWLIAAALAATAAIGIGSSTAASAAPQPTGPAASSGSYTVSYPACSGCAADWLEERVNGGLWRSIAIRTASFTDKPAGIYSYRAAYFYMIDPRYYSTYIDYGPELTVTVAANVPTAEPLETQLNYRYETRSGDGNGDGRADILLSRVAGGTPANGAVDQVLLLQGTTGQFTPVVPSASQTALGATWPVAALPIVLQDINVDGFADVVIKGIPATFGSGLLDQIVYAPARVLSRQPLAVRAVDSGLQRFAANARDYLVDPGYFAQNAPLKTVTQYSYYYACFPSYYGDYYGTYVSCYTFPVAYPVTVPDYSQFDPEAIKAWGFEKAILNGTSSLDQGTRSIQQAFERVLGAPIGGRDLRFLPNERGCLDDIPCRRGYDLFLAVLGIFNANAQELGRNAARRPDTVYVTGRRIMGFLPFHTALEYGGTTVSAHDSDDSTLGDGTLVSQVNWPNDNPMLMLTMGTVSSPFGATPYWAQVRAADALYRDNLPYDAIPSIGAGGYNSNGYSNGIVRATAGLASIDMTKFVGGEKPVPASAFH